MTSLQLALLPGAIAGLISIFTSWLIMGVIFHRFQRATPETWRSEGKGGYAISALIHFAAGILIAALFLLVGRNYGSPFSLGPERALVFGVIAWMAMAAPIIVDAAVFVRLHPLVVVGQLLDWLVTALLATGIAAWWRNT